MSVGEKLPHSLSYYTEPFSQGEKRSSGFGLGLYIVHNILDRLGYKLVYRYSYGKNIFDIVAKRNYVDTIPLIAPSKSNNNKKDI